MTPFFAYLLKSSVSLALFYVLFKLVMSNDKTHRLNRFLLIGIMVVSALLPFIQMPFFPDKTIAKPVEFVREVFVPAIQSTEFSDSTTNSYTTSQNAGFQINLWLVSYLVVIFLLAARFAISGLRISQLYKHAEKIEFPQFILAVVKDIIQPFSFCNRVFLSEKDYRSNKEILIAHEAEHIRQKHHIDLFLAEVFTLLQWYNPFMWLLLRELKLTHEYLADQAVLHKGIDAKKYQLLVLEKAVGERRFAMANHFAQKPILKRIKMMKKNKTTPWNALKIIGFVPLIVFLLQAFTRPGLIQKTEALIPSVFQKNEQEKFLEKWTSENIGKGFFQPEMKPEDTPKTDNNILQILMNAKNEYLIEGEYRKQAEIKQIVKDFLYGRNPDGKKGPDYVEKQIPGFGKLKVSRGVISYQHDLASSAEMVNSTFRVIGEACLEVRYEKAKILFDKAYLELDEQKQQTVEEVAPVWFFYKCPHPPTPSSWLPFERKPSPDPKPIGITINSDRSITVGNYKYNSFDEFKGHLEEWEKQLDKINKGKRSKSYYRAHLTVSAYVPESLYSKVSLILRRKNIHVEKISGEGLSISVLFVELDGDVDVSEIRKSAEETLRNAKGSSGAKIIYKKSVSEEQINRAKEILVQAGISKDNIKIEAYKPPSQATFLLRLYPDKIETVLKDTISLEGVSAKAQEWLSGVGGRYAAKIYAYHDVSEEKINRLKEEMCKGGIKAEINVRKME